MREVKEIAYRPDEKAMVPVRATKDAAGWDLYTAEDVALKPYEAAIIPTGLKIALPEGTALLILPRSGYSIKNQIIMPNSVGLIDEDYRGGVGVPMMWTPPIEEVFRAANSGQTMKFPIPKFTRIAQALLIPYLEQDWRKVDALPETARGSGGFGHTGVGTKDARPAGHPHEVS
jgi:dUTP pyrophosphatase